MHFMFSPDEEKVKRTSLSALDVLKTPDKPSKLELNQSHTLAKNDGMRFSRVSFRLQNEVIAGDEIEAEADGEVKAILHSNNKDLGINKVHTGLTAFFLVLKEHVWYKRVNTLSVSFYV